MAECQRSSLQRKEGEMERRDGLRCPVCGRGLVDWRAWRGEQECSQGHLWRVRPIGEAEWSLVQIGEARRAQARILSGREGEEI